ncbi:MAG: DUF5681 domain-containing protein [Rhodospirillaceae bacterium]
MADEPGNVGPKQDGRFKPGQSGNPAGKAPGTKHHATRMAENLMEGAAESVVQAVLAAAQDGDMVAARLVLERIAPVRKGRPVSLPLPAVNTAGDVLAALGATVKAMADGDITPDEAATVAGGLEVKRRAIETVELTTRLETIERQLGQPK